MLVECWRRIADVKGIDDPFHSGVVVDAAKMKSSVFLLVDVRKGIH